MRLIPKLWSKNKENPDRLDEINNDDEIGEETDEIKEEATETEENKKDKISNINSSLYLIITNGESNDDAFNHIKTCGDFEDDMYCELNHSVMLLIHNSQFTSTKIVKDMIRINNNSRLVVFEMSVYWYDPENKDNNRIIDNFIFKNYYGKYNGYQLKGGSINTNCFLIINDKEDVKGFKEGVEKLFNKDNLYEINDRTCIVYNNTKICPGVASMLQEAHVEFTAIVKLTSIFEGYFHSSLWEWTDLYLYHNSRRWRST